MILDVQCMQIVIVTRVHISIIVPAEENGPNLRSGWHRCR